MHGTLLDGWASVVWWGHITLQERLPKAKPHTGSCAVAMTLPPHM